MINYLHGDTPSIRPRKWTRRIGIQRGPGVLIDFGLQCRLERLIGIVGTEEISLSNKEALLIVVGIDEPACNTLGVIRSNFAGCWIKHIDAIHLHPNLPILLFQKI